MRTTTRNETGAVLITTVVAILMVASLSAALLTTVAVEDTKSRSNDDIVTGDFLADGAAEIAEKLVLRPVVNWMELPRGCSPASICSSCRSSASSPPSMADSSSRS